MYVLRTYHCISSDNSYTVILIVNVVTIRCTPLSLFQCSTLSYDHVYFPYHCHLDGVLTVHIEYCAFGCAATDNDVTQALLRARGVTPSFLMKSIEENKFMLLLTLEYVDDEHILRI